MRIYARDDVIDAWHAVILRSTLPKSKSRGGVGAAVEAVAETIGAIVNLGKDLSPEEREKAREAVIPAVIVTQVAQTAAAMSAMSRIRSKN